MFFSEHSVHAVMRGSCITVTMLGPYIARTGSWVCDVLCDQITICSRRSWVCLFELPLTVYVQKFQPRPLEVLVDGDQWQVIRRPETLQDIVSTFI